LQGVTAVKRILVLKKKSGGQGSVTGMVGKGGKKYSF